jgi:predicted kinase
MQKICYILRGLPGSGKSFLASQLLSSFGGVVCSADDFFFSEDKGYVFDPSKLSNAHEFCKGMFSASIECGVGTVIVDNTNTQKKEFEFYKTYAEDHGYMVICLIVENHHNGSSIHNVPSNTIDKMRQRFQVSL